MVVTSIPWSLTTRAKIPGSSLVNPWVNGASIFAQAFTICFHDVTSGISNRSLLHSASPRWPSDDTDRL